MSGKYIYIYIYIYSQPFCKIFDLLLFFGYICKSKTLQNFIAKLESYLRNREKILYIYEELIRIIVAEICKFSHQRYHQRALLRAYFLFSSQKECEERHTPIYCFFSSFFIVLNVAKRVVYSARVSHVRDAV